MEGYLFSDRSDNAVHDISFDRIKALYNDNLREEKEGRVTNSSYQGKSFFASNNSLKHLDIYKEFVYRDAMTDGFQIYYPHGVILEQSRRRRFFRVENQIYPSSVPTLIRSLRNYHSRKEKEALSHGF